MLEKLEERDRMGAVEHGEYRSEVSELFELLVDACTLAAEKLRGFVV